MRLRLSETTVLVRRGFAAPRRDEVSLEYYLHLVSLILPGIALQSKDSIKTMIIHCIGICWLCDSSMRIRFH